MRDASPQTAAEGLDPGVDARSASAAGKEGLGQESQAAGLGFLGRGSSLQRVRAVIQGELRSLARQKTPFVLRTAYAALAAAIILQMGGSIRAPGMSGQVLAMLAYQAFSSVAFAQTFLAMLAGALLGVASAWSERHNKTLGLLVLSQLTAREVMLGKLCALLGLVALVLIGALPVFAIIGWAGGLDYGWLAALGLLTLVLAGLGVSTGLALGFHYRSGIGAVLASVALLALPLVAARVLPDAGCLTFPLSLVGSIGQAIQEVASQGQGQGDGGTVVLGILVALVWIVMMVRVGSQALVRSAAGGEGRGLRGEFEKLDAFFEGINVGGIRLTSGKHRPPRGNPVAWLGRTSAGLGLPHYGFRLLAAALLLSCWSLVLVLDGGRWAGPVKLFWGGVVTVVALAAGAATFGEEKARGNLALLLATPLSAHAILRGKFYVTLRLLLVIGLPVGAILYFWVSVAGWMAWDWRAFWVYVLAGPVCGYLLARHLSLVLASSLRAGFAAALVLAGLVLFWGFGRHPFWWGASGVATVFGIFSAAVATGVWANARRRPGTALVAFLAALATVFAVGPGRMGLPFGQLHPVVPLAAALCIELYTTRVFDRSLGRSR